MAIAVKSQELREKQRQRKALLITLFISFGLIIGMHLITISQVEYKPAFDYGQWVSYGFDEQGSGKQNIPIQSFETIEEQTPTTEESSVNEPDAVIEEVETSPASETRVKTKKEEKKKEEVKKEENTKNTPQKTESDASKEDTQGQGNDKDKKGVKGKETGINKEGLYSGAGGSGGSSLSLAGWKWEQEPVVKDDSGAEGRIIFSISVDDQGYIISIKPLPGTTIADQRVIQKYKQAVIDAYLVEDNQAGARPPGRSNGTVTFILKAR